MTNKIGQITEDELLAAIAAAESECRAKYEERPDGAFSVRELAQSLKLSNVWTGQLVRGWVHNGILRFVGKFPQNNVCGGTCFVPLYQASKPLQKAKCKSAKDTKTRKRGVKPRSYGKSKPRRRAAP